MARDTVLRLATVDALIAETAERWRLERMALVDRLVLRLAICELLRDAATPPAVVINEAIELAQEYGAAESPRFVNGILGTWVKRRSLPSHSTLDDRPGT